MRAKTLEEKLAAKRKASREYRERNKEEISRKNRERYQVIKADPTRHAAYLAYTKKYAEENKDLIRHKRAVSALKWKYGLSWDEYLTMAEQGCRICGSHEQLKVDHCHTTGKVRAVLCHFCNAGIGFFHENPTTLRDAAAYVEWHKADLQSDEHR